MADSNISLWEYSVQDGQPIECYKFTHDGFNYYYTSSRYEVELTISTGTATRTEKYFADYIQRQTIKPSSKGDPSSLEVSVSKDNPVAKLFQGPPPEKPVVLELYRVHDQDHSKFDTIFTGVIGQANFEDSICNLTIKMENWLSKEFPNLMRQYFCCNVLFDSKCQLSVADWQVEAFVDSTDGFKVYSSTFAQYPDGYFEDGFMRSDESVRLIRQHVGNMLYLQYPFTNVPRHNVTVYPGCNHLFKTCAQKFHNTLNFTGCPYIPPTDSTKTNVGKGVYWVDSLVVKRDTKGYIGTISM